MKIPADQALGLLQAIRRQYPTPLGDSHAAFLLDAARQLGAGLYRKNAGACIRLPDGTTVSQDILMDRAGNKYYDILRDGEGEAVPVFNCGGDIGDPSEIYDVAPQGPIPTPDQPLPAGPMYDEFRLLLEILYARHGRSRPSEEIVALHRTNPGGLDAIDAQLTLDDPPASPHNGQLDRIEAAVNEMRRSGSVHITADMLSAALPMLIRIFRQSLEQVARITVTPKKPPVA